MHPCGCTLKCLQSRCPCPLCARLAVLPLLCWCLQLLRSDIVNYTRNHSRFCFRRPARFFFFVWPWLVILWQEPEIRLFVFWVCDSRGTSWSVLPSVPYVMFLLDSVWLRCEPPRKKIIIIIIIQKRTRWSHCGSTEWGLFINFVHI